MLNLTQCHHVLALAEESHFARAAARVHLSQPAFSRSIQAAERAIGLQLFERARGQIKPTPAGVFLINKARQLLFDARCLERDLHLYGQGELGDTAFGLGPFPAATLLKDIVSSLRARHPKVGVRVEINNWRQLLDRLRKEDIEFFVAATADIAPSSELEIRPLMKQNIHFYVRKNHPLKGLRLSLVDVWAQGVAATKITPTLKSKLSGLMELDPTQELSLALQCDDVDVLHHTALCTDTVIISSDMAVHKKGHDKSLRKLDIRDFPATQVQVGIVSLHKRTHSPMALEIISVFKQAVLSSS